MGKIRLERYTFTEAVKLTGREIEHLKKIYNVSATLWIVDGQLSLEDSSNQVTFIGLTDHNDFIDKLHIFTMGCAARLGSEIREIKARADKAHEEFEARQKKLSRVTNEWFHG